MKTYAEKLVSELKPLKVNNPNTVIKLEKKFGVGFIQDLKIICTHPHASLAGIAGKYDLTRQGVSLMFQKVFGVKYLPLHEKKISIRKKLNEQQKYHPAERVARLRGYARNNAIAQLKVYGKCNKLGYNIETIGPQETFINNYKVFIVTTGYVQRGHAKTRYFRIPIRNRVKHIKENYDFLIVYVSHNNSFYIIPSKEIDGPELYIREKPSKHYYCKNKYLEYLKAWHLLK